MKRVLGVLCILTLLIGFTLSSKHISASTFVSLAPNTQLSTPSTASPYGITIEDKTGQPNFTDAAANDFQQAGATWARVQIPWKEIELTQGQYTWTPLNTAVGNARAHNLLIDFSIANVPGFPGYTDSTCGLPTPNATSTFALALIKQINTAGYGDVIKAIEVGNEDWSFVPQGDPSSCTNNAGMYIPVLEQTSTAIKQGGVLNGQQVQGIPGMLVGTEGFTNYDTANNPNEQHNVHNFWYPFFADSSDPGSYIDFANFHFYHEGVDPNQPVPPSPQHPNGKDPYSAIWNEIHTDAATANSLHHHGNKAIWTTETGWHINDNIGRQDSSCVHEIDQKTFENEMLEDGRTSGGSNGTGGFNPPIVTHIFFYTMDTGSDGMSITQTLSGNPPAPTLCFPPPLNSCTGPQSPNLYYTAAYCMLRNYSGKHPTWP